jgi:preprotein translocase subunit SecB
MTTNTQPLFSIEKLYVRDLSLEVPNAPEVFLEQGNPEVSIQLNSSGRSVGENLFEVTLKVSVDAKLGEKSIFLVETEQAGIFRLENIPEADVAPILGVTCPNILFPYARELISSSISRAGFQPVMLAPVNFEALYLQQQKQQAEAQVPAAAPVQ